MMAPFPSTIVQTLHAIVARYGHLLKFRAYNTFDGRLNIQNNKLFKNFEGAFWPHSACRAQIWTQTLQRNFTAYLYTYRIIGVQNVSCYHAACLCRDDEPACAVAERQPGGAVTAV